MADREQSRRAKSSRLAAEPQAAGAAIVLAPAGNERAAERALSEERQWRVTAVCDPMLAMAEVALAERARETREQWELDGSPEHPNVQTPIAMELESGSDQDMEGSGAHGEVAFVLAHPKRWAMRDDLLDAIVRYFPETHIFVFDERGLREAKLTRKPRNKSKRRPNGTSDRSQPAAAPVSRDENDVPKSDLAAITRDEIDMLLGEGE